MKQIEPFCIQPPYCIGVEIHVWSSKFRIPRCNFYLSINVIIPPSPETTNENREGYTGVSRR